MSNGVNSTSAGSGASDAGVGSSDNAVATNSSVGGAVSQTAGTTTQISAPTDNGGSNNNVGTSTGTADSGSGAGGKKKRRPPTAAQTAARKKAAEQRKQFRDRVNLIAQALEEQEGRVKEPEGGAQQPSSDQGQESSQATETAAGSAGGQELDQSGDDQQLDEMDMVDHGAQPARPRSKRDVYFNSRVRRTRGMHRVGNGFQEFLAGSTGEGVRLPSATAMRQQTNWARVPGTTLLDRMAAMNARANASANMSRSVRLPRYLEF